MRHFSSTLGWDVNLWCLLFELCLIFKTKKIKLGSLVKFLLSNKSLQSLQQPPACSLKWTWVRGYKAGKIAAGGTEGVKCRRGGGDEGNSLKKEDRYNAGSGQAWLWPPSPYDDGHHLHCTSILVFSLPWASNKLFRALCGWVNLRPTMLLKGDKKKENCQSLIIYKVKVILGRKCHNLDSKEKD